MSLLESTMAIVVVGLILASTMSTVHVVVGGAARMEERSARNIAVSLALLRLRSELRMALTVTELTGSAITFTHPDFTGDGGDEAIRYAWSGKEGEALTREVNGGGPEEILDECRSFSLRADIADLAEGTKPGWSDETLIAVHDSYPAGYSQGTGATDVSRTRWFAQYFVPWADGATACRITRASLSLYKGSDPNGNLYVALRPPLAGSVVPGSQTLDYASVPIASLPSSAQWISISLPGKSELATGTGVTLVLYCDGGIARMRYGYLTFENYNDGMCMNYSTTSGASWIPGAYTNRWDIRAYIYGEYNNTSEGTGEVESGLLRGLLIGLAAGAAEDPVITDTTVECVNRPPLAGLPIDEIVEAY